MRRQLESDGFPRLQMTLIVAITGAAGFVASYLLLHAGLREMWVRYPAAVGFSYLVFLFLLWLWLRSSASDYADIPDFSGVGTSGSSGGGCGSELTESHPVLPGDSGDVGDVLGAAADTDEFAIPLVAIILFAVLILSSFWVIYTAPALFAELLVDGALAAGLYRRLRGGKPHHWIETAVRRTGMLFLATAVLVAACGWLMTIYAPGARSIGDVLAHARQPRHEGVQVVDRH